MLIIPLTNDVGQNNGRDILAQQGEDHTRYGYHNTELERKRRRKSGPWINLSPW